MANEEGSNCIGNNDVVLGVGSWGMGKFGAHANIATLFYYTLLLTLAML